MWIFFLIASIPIVNTCLHAKNRWPIFIYYRDILGQSYVVILSRILLYVTKSVRVIFLKFVNKILRVKILEFLQRGPIVG